MKAILPEVNASGDCVAAVDVLAKHRGSCVVLSIDCVSEKMVCVVRAVLGVVYPIYFVDEWVERGPATEACVYTSEDIVIAVLIFLLVGVSPTKDILFHISVGETPTDR